MNQEAGVPAPPAAAGDDAQSLEALRAALGADFEIKQKLGRGSMATVYLAREKALGRLVAVKVLLAGRAGDETARKRFEREAKAAATLSQPNVVQVYRFGRLPDGTPYLVMRFVKGRTLEERLAAEGRLPAALARTVLLGVASALEAAHAQGIVHRDVRPANVLWDEEAQQALLADFGIAALLATGGEEVTKLTKTGQMIGNPKYMSPEQLLDQDLTELADMYAFGILGYELFTGEGPYQAKTNTQWISAHLSAEPRDLKQMRPDIDASTADLLKRCLNREPKHRPSAAKAASTLRGEAGTGPGGEGPVDIQELIKRRVPQIVLVAVGGGYALLTGISQFIGNDSLTFRLALPFVGSAVVATTIIAWFHGERGKQKTSVLEWILLSLVGVIWLSLTAWILIA
ncbi:MAG: serine/threonine protein kinase [Gemmatimonadetes bacterium]|nr:serine/threonine protein kinase [Gemmatimonadota bacterium]